MTMKNRIAARLFLVVALIGLSIFRCRMFRQEVARRRNCLN
jgi:hypothetical protein